MDLIVYIIAGVAIGGVIVFIILNKNINKIRIEKDELVNRLDSLILDLETRKSDLKVVDERLSMLNEVVEEKKIELSKQIENSKNEIDKKENTIVQLNTQLATTSTDLKNMQAKLQENKKEVEEVRTKFQLEFKNLANEILEEKSKKFTEQNKTNISDILKPLNAKIQEFEKKVSETYDKESKQRFSLEKEIQRLAELNQQISQDASNLTNALKGQSKMQGDWGELILEKILESTGLVKDREYSVQQSFTDKDGKRLQPDVVINYPGNRDVIIDSKVSLVAFEKYSSASKEEDQKQAAKEHLLSVRRHIDELSKKNYHSLYQLNSLDFVFLFMPIEPAYMLAMQLDSELWKYAYDKQIIIMSPTILITALKMVAGLWQQENQSKNVQEIAKQSGQLYDKFVGFLGDLQDIGKKLSATQTAYDNSMNKLQDGKGNLVRRVELIKELGAKTKKSIPLLFLEDNTELPS